MGETFSPSTAPTTPNPTTASPTEAPASSTPSTANPTPTPTVTPVSSAPTVSPTTSAPTIDRNIIICFVNCYGDIGGNFTVAPTASPASTGPTATGQTWEPTTSPASTETTPSPTAAPVSSQPSSSPSSRAPTANDETFAPTESPNTASPTPAPTSSAPTYQGQGNIGFGRGGPIIVQENETSGYSVLNVTAFWNNDGSPVAAVYSLSSVSGRRARRDVGDLPFAIDESSGEVVLNATVDFETQPYWLVRVTAAAVAEPRQGSAVINITVEAVACPDGFWSVTGTYSCTVSTLCADDEVEEQAPTPTSDRVCTRPVESEAVEKTAGGDEGKISALFLLLLLLFLLGGFIYRRNDRADEHELTKGDDHLSALNPIHDGHGPGFGDLEMQMLGADSLRQGSDDTFNRVVSYDMMYHGNEPLKLSNNDLGMVYSLLELKAPDPDAMQGMRLKTRNFLDEKVDGPQPTVDDIIADAVEFLARALPDVLVDRAIDCFAFSRNPSDKELLAGLTNEYFAAANPFLEKDETTGAFLPADRSFYNLAAKSAGASAWTPPEYCEANNVSNGEYLPADGAHNASNAEFLPDGAMYDMAGNTAAQRADPVYGLAAQGSVRTEAHREQVYDSASPGGSGEQVYDNAPPGKTSAQEHLYETAAATEAPRAQAPVSAYDLASTPLPYDKYDAEAMYDNVVDRPITRRSSSYGDALEETTDDALYDSASAGVTRTIVPPVYNAASQSSGDGKVKPPVYDVSSGNPTRLNATLTPAAYDVGAPSSSLAAPVYDVGSPSDRKTATPAAPVYDVGLSSNRKAATPAAPVYDVGSSADRTAVTPAAANYAAAEVFKPAPPQPGYDVATDADTLPLRTAPIPMEPEISQAVYDLGGGYLGIAPDEDSSDKAAIYDNDESSDTIATYDNHFVLDPLGGSVRLASVQRRNPLYRNSRTASVLLADPEIEDEEDA